jgi:hypothetical protein
MGGILQVDTIQNNNATTLITQTNSTTLTFGVSGQNIIIPSGVTFNTASATVNLPSSIITGQTAVTVPATDDVLLCYDTSATALRKITFANFGNAPAFMAFNDGSTTQSISNSSWTEITNFKTETFDSDNAFNTTTGRYTPQVGGKYFFTTEIYSATAFAAGFNGIILTKNGTITANSTSELCYITRLATGESEMRVNGFLTMNGTSDYVSVFINQQTGGSVNIGGASVSQHFFGGYRLIGV